MKSFPIYHQHNWLNNRKYRQTVRLCSLCILKWIIGLAKSVLMATWEIRQLKVCYCLHSRCVFAWQKSLISSSIVSALLQVQDFLICWSVITHLWGESSYLPSVRNFKNCHPLIHPLLHYKFKGKEWGIVFQDLRKNSLYHWFSVVLNKLWAQPWFSHCCPGNARCWLAAVQDMSSTHEKGMESTFLEILGKRAQGRLGYS